MDPEGTAPAPSTGAAGAGAPPTSAALRSRLLRTPKRGEATSDDAGAADDRGGRYALCDGVTRSAFSGAWAEILAGHVRAEGLPPARALRAWLTPARVAWDARRRTIVASRPAWFLQAARSGGATLLALELEPAREDGERRFTGAVLGDTCAFQVRGEALVGEPFPLRRSADFSASVACLTSVPEGDEEPVLSVVEGLARPGDTFFLATDALAKWILKEVEAGRAPWRRLEGLDAPPRFSAFADEERAAKRMDEDDVSLLVVEILADAPPSAASRVPVSLDPKIEVREAAPMTDPGDGDPWSAPSSRGPLDTASTPAPVTERAPVGSPASPGAPSPVEIGVPRTGAARRARGKRRARWRHLARRRRSHRLLLTVIVSFVVSLLTAVVAARLVVRLVVGH